MFQFLAQEKYDHVILGALGCGAFGNPPHQVASIFHELLQQYAGLLPPVTFAILGERNLTAFRSVLAEKYAPAAKELVNPIYSMKWNNPAFTFCGTGGRCLSQDTEDPNLIYHPPSCPNGQDCALAKTSIVHATIMTHPGVCPQGTFLPHPFSPPNLDWS